MVRMGKMRMRRTGNRWATHPVRFVFAVFFSPFFFRRFFFAGFFSPFFFAGLFSPVFFAGFAWIGGLFFFRRFFFAVFFSPLFLVSFRSVGSIPTQIHTSPSCNGMGPVVLLVTFLSVGSILPPPSGGSGVHG